MGPQKHRRERRKWDAATMIAVVEEVNGGARPSDVIAKHDIASSVLIRWRRMYAEGTLHKKLARAQAKDAPAAHIEPGAPPLATLRVVKGNKGKTYTRHSLEDKLAACRAHEAGMPAEAVAIKYGISKSNLYNWRHALKSQLKRAAKVNGHVPASTAARQSVAVLADESGPTPQEVFGARVQKAIITLRQAQGDVTLKEASSSQLLSALALRFLQGEGGQ